jgi:hypothetical protein
MGAHHIHELPEIILAADLTTGHFLSLPPLDLFRKGQSMFYDVVEKP